MSYYSTIAKLYSEGTLRVGSVIKVPDALGESYSNGKRYAEFILVHKNYGVSSKSVKNALLMRRYLVPEGVYNQTPKKVYFENGGRAFYENSSLDYYLNGHGSSDEGSANESYKYKAFHSNNMEHVLAPCSPGFTYMGSDTVHVGGSQSERYIFAPSCDEIGTPASDVNAFNISGEGSCFDYFNTSSKALRRAAMGASRGESDRWHTRSVQVVFSPTYHTTVQQDGELYGLALQTNKFAVRPFVSINDKCTILVDGSSFTLVPNLPATGTGISGTVPASVRSDQSFTVSWTQGSDPDSSSSNIRYRVERRFNNGSWSVVGTYQNVTSITDVVNYSTTNRTVSYRVLCIDEYDNTDDVYITLGTASIVNNASPSMYGSINVTGQYKNSTLTLRWNRATDTDNNLTSYQLYRSVDGGAYEFLKNVNSDFNQTTDEVEDWDTVQYKVFARDTLNATSNDIYSPEIRLVTEFTMAVTFPGSSEQNHLQNTESGQDPTLNSSSGTVYADFLFSDETDEPRTYKYTFYLDGQVYNNGTTVYSNVTIPVPLENREANIQISFPKDFWQKLKNGIHSMVLAVTDNLGRTATLNARFKKAVHTAKIKLDPVFLSEGVEEIPSTFKLNIAGRIPTNAVMSIQVTRNAGTDNPDFTNLTSSQIAKVNTGESIEFSGEEPALEDFGFAAIIQIARASGDTSDDPYYISSITGMVGNNIFVDLQTQIDALKNA